MRNRFRKWRKSRGLVLIVVTVAMFLDAILRSVIVPILPDLLSSLPTSDFQYFGTFKDISRNHRKVVTSDGSSTTQSMKIGFLLASESFFEMLSSPIFGHLSYRFGCSVIMFAGFVITFCSTMVYTFGESYELLLVARSFQGVGSAMTTAPGLGMLAITYPDGGERGNAMAIAFAGVGVGALVGPVYGGMIYQSFGKVTTFLILAVIVLIDGCLRMCIVESKDKSNLGEKGVSMKTLLKDPYILIVLGTIFISNGSFGVLQCLLPVHMSDTMNTSSLEQGLAFAPMNLTFLLACKLLGSVHSMKKKCWMALVGTLLTGVFIMLTIWTNSLIELIFPSAGVGVAYALVESTMFPHLAYLVDLRHTSVYGSVYGLAQFTLCLASVLSTTVSGTLNSTIGFSWTIAGISILCILYSPLLYFLQNPATKEELQLLRYEKLRYTVESDMAELRR